MIYVAIIILVLVVLYQWAVIQVKNRHIERLKLELKAKDARFRRLTKNVLAS